ncbi:MAG: hypothetical protein GF308_18020 [Candidatus Heimdallarchaeota archaeon]|nr:hypothetical protein [Candidatus Heimdallarchaeota archaeon]
MNFFNKKSELTREELVEKIELLKEKQNFDIYVYKSWSGSYDFIRFVTDKLEFMIRKNSLFFLSKLGEQYKKILIAKESFFKRELFRHVYIISMTKATRFRDFCDFLKINTNKEGVISLEKFRLAKKKVLHAKQFSNLNVISFLKDIGLLDFKNNSYINVNIGLFALIDPEEIALKIIKDNLDTNKELDFKIAEKLLLEQKIDPKILDTLREKEKIIIRGTRTSKYIDFS